MAVRAGETAAVRIADERHLEHLLDAAEGALDRGETKLAVTHLSQAAFVGATKGTSLSELELLRRVKRLIDAHGGLA